MPPSEVEKLFRAFAEKRKAELPRFTPDGIPITLENKFDDAIYNYLYKYWKTNSGEYDPKDDETIMTKENSFTKNEKKFEQWLLQQYGMTNKEQREYTVKGNLLSLGEIALSAWGIEGAGATKLVVPGKFLASNADDTAKKALQQDTIEDAVEGTLKKEVAEEVAENTAKKEMADTAEDLSQKIVDKENSDIIKENNGTLKNGRTIGFQYKHNPSDNPKVLADAIEDPSAVYGYRPRSDGSLSMFADADWNNPIAVEGYKRDRIAYHNRNEGAAIQIVKEMSAKGASTEDIARAVNQYRNQSRLNAYIDSDGNIINPKGYNAALERMELRSYDNLIKQGKTPEQIIESATRGNPAMDACVGLYDEYFDSYGGLK